MMGIIIALVAWVICSVIAAGWAWADEKDYFLFWICLIFGPAGIIATTVTRFTTGYAFGWAWPPLPHLPKVNGHWFKREKRFYNGN